MTIYVTEIPHNHNLGTTLLQRHPIIRNRSSDALPFFKQDAPPNCGQINLGSLNSLGVAASIASAWIALETGMAR